MLPEANTKKKEGKYPMIKVLWGCIFKLVLILYRAGNMQFAILVSFIASSSLLSCGLQSTHLPLPCHISPYVVYNIYDLTIICPPSISCGQVGSGKGDFKKQKHQKRKIAEKEPRGVAFTLFPAMKKVLICVSQSF